MGINDIQDNIIEEFEILAEDRESTIFYIMELGEKLPQFDEDARVDSNLIKGCQSKVWLYPSLEDGKVYFYADSNTEITKGLISLLIRIFNGQNPEDIMNTDLYFVEKIGMHLVIGSQQSNGFSSMIKQMKLYALAFSQIRKTKNHITNKFENN